MVESGGRQKLQKWMIECYALFSCPMVKQFTTPSLIDHLGDTLMQIQYFQGTDTLYVVFNANQISETKDLDENILIDLDKNGNLVSMTLDHASEHTDIASFSYQQIAAPVVNGQKLSQAHPVKSKIIA